MYYAAFLSVQILPDNATRVIEGKASRSRLTTTKLPFLTIFIPKASPEKQVNLKQIFLPETIGSALFNFPKEAVLSNALFQEQKVSWIFTP